MDFEDLQGGHGSRITLLQPPLGNFDSLGEPHFGKAFGVLDELIDDLGPKRDARNKGMEIKREVFRSSLFSLPIKVIKLVFHDLQ